MPPRDAPKTRGILRQSSYSTAGSVGASSTPSSPSSSTSEDENIDSATVTTASELKDQHLKIELPSNMPELPTESRRRGNMNMVRRMGPRPQRPQRRNVGKVEHSHGKRPQRSLPTRGRGLGPSISFNENVKVREIEPIARSKSNEFFYDDDEIAEFRYEKHLEDCGLDPEEFK